MARDSVNGVAGSVRTIRAMSDRWTNQVAGESGRAFRFVVGQPSWVMRLALTAAAIVLLAVLAVLIIPAMVIGVIAFIMLATVARVRAWIGGVRRPNGALDGRRNVRVIVRE